MLDQVLIFMLLFISSQVAIGLKNHKNMWKWIVAYWTVLTVKNFFNFVA